MKKKRILVYIAKTIAASALLAGLIVLWAFLAFILSSGGLLNSYYEPGKLFLLVVISIAMAVGYFAFAFWLSKLGKEELTGGKDSAVNRFGKPVLTLVLPAVGIIILIAASGSIKYKISEAQARSYVKKSDVSLSYGIGKYDSIMSTGLSENTVLVDFSLNRVTFLYHVDYDQMLSVQLKHTESFDMSGKEIQYQYDIKEQNALLTTYYTPDDSSDKGVRMTSGVSLELSDGSIWYSDIEPDYIGFETALSGDILKTEEWAEQILAFGSDELPDYCEGYSRPTLFVNLDSMSLKVLYKVQNGAGMKKLELSYVSDRSALDNAGVQHMFELYNGGVLLACHDLSFENDDRTNIFVYITPEEEYYATSSENWGYYGFGKETVSDTDDDE